MVSRFLLLALLVPTMLGTPAKAADELASAYVGESAFLSLTSGEAGTFTVFFANAGSTSWTRRSDTQVDLAICREDKTTCDVFDSGKAPFNAGWLSATRYAAQSQDVVAPGQIASFTYRILVPDTAQPGSYRFHGTLVVSRGGARIRDEGYYHELTVLEPGPAPSVTDMTPPFGSASGGTEVTLRGEGFVCSPDKPTVRFATADAALLECAAGRLVVASPAGFAGPASVTVRNLHGAPSAPLVFSYLDRTPPELASAAAAGRLITLTFSEPVCRTGPLAAREITYAVAGGADSGALAIGPDLVATGLPLCSPRTPTTAQPSSQGSATFSVFALAPFADGQTVAVNFQSVSGRLVDRAGNLAGAARLVTTASADQTRPYVVQAEQIANDQLRLTYSELVSCTGQGPDQFTSYPDVGVAVSGLGVTCDPGPSAGSGGSTTVTVKFFADISPPYFEGELAYVAADHAADRISDLAGNEADSPQTVVYYYAPPSLRPAPTIVQTALTTKVGFSSQLQAGDVFVLGFSDTMDATAPDDVVLLLEDGDGTQATISCLGTATCAWNDADVDLSGTRFTAHQLLTVTLLAGPDITELGTLPGLQLPATILEALALVSLEGKEVDLDLSFGRDIFRD